MKMENLEFINIWKEQNAKIEKKRLLDERQNPH